MHVDLDLDKVMDVLHSSSKMNAIANDVCDDVIASAKSEFLRQETEKPDRSSELSPPRYMQSFGRRREENTWRIENRDPGAMLVEFGAHPGGGDTETLKYAPLRRGLDIVASKNE